ncbi:uncharacterized protein LOC111315712 [Durio zibethinus]|uniref:Uncharacterized protein LOC111315712 n=1 Tax=Durio zibethinus TaxID=66656 RepID=A0A6P6B864_DURZI|nr:uncharacterized protein LOC111315712 [Durio zibethinus]
MIISTCFNQSSCSKVQKIMSGTSFPNASNAIAGLIPSGNHHQTKRNDTCCYFQMPLHYPRYKKSDYENIPESQLDCLLKEYGLPAVGDVNQKRKFAIGAFLWPSQDE